MAVEAIVTAADTQYVEDLEEDYVSYKTQTIKTIIKKLQTWYVIMTKEKLAIKAHFLVPWSDTPGVHVTTFARQLERRQVECKDHGVTVTKADKMDHFLSQMYAYNLFEVKFLDN